MQKNSDTPSEFFIVAKGTAFAIAKAVFRSDRTYLQPQPSPLPPQQFMMRSQGSTSQTLQPQQQIKRMSNRQSQFPPPQFVPPFAKKPFIMYTSIFTRIAPTLPYAKVKICVHSFHERKYNFTWNTSKDLQDWRWERSVFSSLRGFVRLV